MSIPPAAIIRRATRAEGYRKRLCQYRPPAFTGGRRAPVGLESYAGLGTLPIFNPGQIRHFRTMPSSILPTRVQTPLNLGDRAPSRRLKVKDGNDVVRFDRQDDPAAFRNSQRCPPGGGPHGPIWAIRERDKNWPVDPLHRLRFKVSSGCQPHGRAEGHRRQQERPDQEHGQVEGDARFSIVHGALTFSFENAILNGFPKEITTPSFSDGSTATSTCIPVGIPKEPHP